MAIVFNNSTRANAASDMILKLHPTSSRIVKGFEEYKHKIKGAYSIANIEETSHYTFASR